MTEFRREMEQEGFSPGEFVERLAWRTVTSGGDFDAEVLHNTFSGAMDDLRGVLEMQRIKCTQLEGILTKEEHHLRTRLMLLLHRNSSSAENLGLLEKKVNTVATKVVHLGDQLESVNLPRQRTSEAAKLMKHLADFLQPGTILLSDIFRDKEKLYDAAEIIQKLQIIAQDLSSSGSSSAKFDAAVKKINQKYDEIERMLIEDFVNAQVIDDRDKMKQITHILYNFKGYSQCVNAFIQQSQVGAFKAKDVFDDVVVVCDQYKPMVDQVFPNPGHVMGKFVVHIFQDRIQETVTNQLYEKQITQDKFLRNLAILYSKTKKIVKQLDSFDLGNDMSFLQKITEQIFRPHLESYVSVEIKYLQTKCFHILAAYYDKLGHQKRAIQSSFQDFRRDIQAVIGTRANINIAQIENYGGETFLSEEVAINLLQESRMAYSRCDLLSRRSDVPLNASQIFDILSQSLLKEHVDYALELGLQGIPIPEAKNQPEIYFFAVVKSCNAIVHLYEKEFVDSLLPLISASPKLSECMEKKNAVLEQIEMKLDAGLDRSIDTIVGWVKVILQSEQNKKEYFRTETFNENEPLNAVSPACMKIVRFVNSQSAKMKDSIDGQNIEAVLLELGTRLHRVIYEHVLVFQYSSIGAVRILCDINEYLKCVKEFKIQIVTDIFETLKSLCNLFYELPKDLNRIFNHADLSKIDPSIRMNFVQLRTDFKTARLQLTISSNTNNKQ
ncbi:exocyst complex component 5 [Folsomia candida]|uniref:Exocyst complex component 5 n=1 Tax=Folsomia candida TaxID=158441 RepID=A0A226EQI4_FOLCA|nr:exocyst complex component 5 [Folsomia candida]OXA59892.1 Exocyst complex component 5 [Folsomia candida]